MTRKSERADGFALTMYSRARMARVSAADEAVVAVHVRNDDQNQGVRVRSENGRESRSTTPAGNGVKRCDKIDVSSIMPA